MTAMNEEGFVTAEWMAGIAVLVLPILVIITVLPAWAARHEAAAAAAREGARVAATAATHAQAVAGAQQVVAAALAARGLPVDGIDVLVHADQDPDGSLARQGSVTVTVRLPSPFLAVPMIGRVDGPVLTGSHTRHLDPLRSRP